MALWINPSALLLFIHSTKSISKGFPSGTVVKNMPANAGTQV